LSRVASSKSSDLSFLPTSILARFPWSRTLNSFTSTRERMYRSDFSILRSFSGVIVCPYSTREDRHGFEGFSEFGSLRILHNSLTSALVTSKSANGLRTPRSDNAAAPGLWPFRSSAFVPSIMKLMPSFPASRVSFWLNSFLQK